MKTVYIVLPPTPNELSIPFNTEFCLSFMKEQLGTVHPLFPMDCRLTCGDLIDSVPEADRLIVVRSGVMAMHVSLERLAEACGNDNWTIVGPVMVNGASDQISPLPFSYADVETFRELTEWLLTSRKGSVRHVETLSDDVFGCSPVVLKRFPANLPVTEIGSHAIWCELSKMVVEDSIAHSFSNYYRHPRMDLIDLIPDHVRFVLDVGCAEGAIGRYLKQHRTGIICVGIEPDPTAAGEAQKDYDRVYVQPVENTVLPERFDCIVCGDILEHLIDPQNVLKMFHAFLHDQGILVGSVPNIGHWSVIRELMKGRFQYVPAGILCRDHLRFFTEDSLRNMLRNSGYIVEYLGYNQPIVSPEGRLFIEKLEKGFSAASASLTSEQFVFRSIKMPSTS